MSLKNLYGNSVVLVILLHLFCECRYNHQTASWFHAYWSFILEPTSKEDDESYPITDLKINCRCNSNNERLRSYMMVTTVINKIDKFFNVLFQMSRNKGMKFQNDDQKNINNLMVPKLQ